MTDTLELHLANRTVWLTPDEQDEWARRAVKNFQGMEYLWTSFARVLTGNPSVRVVMSGGPSRTDGQTIYYRPPLMLGDPSPHVRTQCDRRDADGHLICPACSSRESVERSVTHEIAHITGGSFQKSSPNQQQRALRQAVEYAKNPIAKAHLEAGLRRVQWGDDVQAMMHKMSPFLGLIIMALEDARIDMQMFKARPGVRKMFESSQKRFATTGQVDINGELIQWSTRPLNAQIMIGLLWQAEGFGLGDLHDKVKHDLKDPALQDICLRVGRSGSALEIAALTIETLTRLWELGYCEPPEDMPEPPPFQPPAPPQPSQDEEPDDQDEPDPEEQSGDDAGDSSDSDDDAGDEESPQEDSGDPGADESDSGSGTPGEGDGRESAESPAGQSDGDDLQADSPGGEDLSEPGGDESSGESDGSQSGDAGEAGDEPAEGSGDQDPDDGGSPSDTGDEESGSGDSEPDADSTGDQEQRGDADSDRSDDGGAPDGGQSGEDEADGEATEAGPVGDESGSSSDQSGSDEAAGSSGSEPDDDPLGGEEGGEESSGGSGTEAPEDDAAGVRDDGGSGEDGSSESTDDSAGGEDDGDSPTEGDRDLGKQGESGSDGTPGSEPGDRASEAEGDNGGEDPAGGGDSEGSADRSLDAGDTGSTAGDDGAGDPVGSLPIPDEADGAPEEEASDDRDSATGAGESEPEDLPEHGAADDIADLIQDLTGHNHEDDEVMPGVESADMAEQQAIDKAIVQNKHFDSPTKTVSDLRVYEWPRDDERCEAWAYGRAPTELTIRIGDHDRQGRDQWDILRTPEEIMQPALFELRRVLSDNRRARDERNLKRGKLDGRALGKRAWQNDPERLYKKRTRPKNRSYAVIIAGDCSWSQHLGKTMVVTKQAMFAQADLCHRMGIDFEVWAHTAEYNPETKKRLRQGEDIEPTFDMVMNQIKSWTDPWSLKQQEGLAWLHAVETNLDGHNLEFLRKRLMHSTATDKILLYYTDGEMPAANYDDELEVFKRELTLYQQLGIVIVGVGVGTDSPTRWGLPTVRVDKKGDIGKVVKHLEGEILRQRR